MKNLSKNFSLPKITSRFIEELIKQNTELPVVRNHLKRLTYNKSMQSLEESKNNRFTEANYRLGDNEFEKHQNSQVLNISSPFYRKINTNNVKNLKCQCNLFHGNQSLEFPIVKKSPCKHQQILENKIQHTEKYHENLVNSVKKNHKKLHEKIHENERNYLSHSLENSEKIRAQKYIDAKKNAEELKVKLEKIKLEDKFRKELAKIQLKDRLEEIYKLDNENDSYEKIMEARNKWYREKKLWAAKILREIHSELKQVRSIKEKMLSSNLKNQLIEVAYNENILLDIEKCLAVILNTVESIEELLIGESIGKVTTKVEQIFKKILEFNDKTYGKKLCKKLSEIVEKFYLYPTKIDAIKAENDEQKERVGTSKIEENLKTEEEVKKSEKIIEDLNSHIKYSTPVNRTLKFLEEKPTIEANEVETNEDERTKYKKSPKISCISIKTINSKKSISLKRTKKENNTFKISNKTSLVDKEKGENTGRSIKSNLSNQSKNSSKNVKEPTKEITEAEGIINDNTLATKTTIQITPFLTQHIIDEIDEFMLAENTEDVDSENEDEYAKEKALKFIEATKLAKEQYEKDEAERIDYVIDYVKTKIRMRQANKLIISKKYENIQYQKFCTENTFKYITSMIDEFEGNKKFAFLYSQLRLKKSILNDAFVSEAIETFKEMFEEEEFLKWKDYLFEQRNKIIFEKLNKMIDLGMKEISNFQFEEAPIEKIDSEEERLKSKEFAVFNKVDQSQIAYERFLQKKERTKNQSKSSLQITERDLNLTKKQNDVEESKNEEGPVTQKTIHSHIESNSTKSIKYTFVENEKSINSLKRGLNCLNKGQNICLADDESKKKVLKYMLKRKPQQFQLLNKDVNTFSQYVKTNFVEQDLNV